MEIADDFGATNNTLGALAVGGAVVGNIEFAGDKDWFKTTLEKGKTYVFDLSGTATGGGSLGSNNGHGRLSLFDAAGLPLESIFNGGIGGEPKLSYTPSLSGVYFLEAADMSIGVGSYTLKSTALPTTPAPGGNGSGTIDDGGVTLPTDTDDDFAATVSTTGALAIAGQVAGTIETAGDKDWFKVSLKAGTSYVFDLVGQGGGGGTLGATGSHGRLSLVSADGTYLNSMFNGGTGGDPKLSFTPATAGTYYLEAADIGAGTGTYTLKWTLPTSETPSGGGTGGGQIADPALTGTDAAESFNGGTGDDVIDGKGGIDYAEFSLNRGNYALNLGSTEPTVQALQGLEGLDTLQNIERLQFADRKVAIDITGNALHTVQFIGTVAPSYMTNLNVRGMIIKLLDQNNSLEQLGLLALEMGLLPAEASELGISVHRNVFNNADPSPELANELTNYINYHGAAKFIADVAERGFNVDLIGLETNGMEYF